MPYALLRTVHITPSPLIGAFVYSEFLRANGSFVCTNDGRLSRVTPCGAVGRVRASIRAVGRAANDHGLESLQRARVSGLFERLLVRIERLRMLLHGRLCFFELTRGHAPGAALAAKLVADAAVRPTAAEASRARRAATPFVGRLAPLVGRR